VVNTLREHYIALAKTEITDRVMEKMQAESWGEVRGGKGDRERKRG
jgi:hypothetical protein